MVCMKLDDIKISEKFVKPRANKFLECEKKFLQSGKQDRYLVLNSKNQLIDGYIMYLILKKYGCETAKVEHSCVKKKKYHRINSDHGTTYVLGTHCNNPKKAYYWRIPDSWERFKKVLQPGDEIICNNKNGRSLVKVLKVETLLNPPAEGTIRRVAPCSIRRGTTMISQCCCR